MNSFSCFPSFPSEVLEIKPRFPTPFSPKTSPEELLFALRSDVTLHFYVSSLGRFLRVSLDDRLLKSAGTTYPNGITLNTREVNK